MMTSENIKQQFIAEATAHGKAIGRGDYRKANKLYSKIQSLHSQAREQNQVELFTELLNEPDENVRLWAATFTLRMFPEAAEESLAKLSELSTITALSAKTTLQLWKEGKLELP